MLPLQRLIHCKINKNDTNFAFQHVNNCYISGIIMHQSDCEEEWKVFFTTCQGQSRFAKTRYSLCDRPRQRS